jgi:C-terminal processing protease CtpA/Prc
LLLVLEQGPGRFLQKVNIEPHLARGRFVGWRILALFPDEPATTRGVLQPGDTLVRVNGQSVERPEQFKNVWDSLATESQLVLQVMRAGKVSEVRHRIVQSASSVAGQSGGRVTPGAAVPSAISGKAAGALPRPR